MINLSRSKKKEKKNQIFKLNCFGQIYAKI